MINKRLALLTTLALTFIHPLIAQNGTITGKVTDKETGEAISGAQILIIGAQKMVRSKRDGRYSITSDPGSQQLLVSASGFEITEKPVTVKAGETSVADVALTRVMAQFGEEMVVLGSRAVRSAVESPVPVDVIGQKELEEIGMTETSKALQFLAPSFNFPTSTISDGSDIVRPSTLRGMGPDQSLVLLNGKRRYNTALVHVNGSVGRGTAGVDLNAIPSSALERIEVLRDGASAQYGSDAISGVINLQLKSSPGTEVAVNTGEHFEGDGQTVQASINHGWAFGDRGFFHVTAEMRNRDRTNRAGLDPRQQYASLPDGSADPREASFDRLNHRYGDAESENTYIFINSSFPIGDGDLYLFGGIAQRDGESGGFYRRSLDGRNRPEVHPDGFLPLIVTEVDDQSLAIGYKTLIGAWSFDLSASNGGNNFDFNIENSVNASVGADPDLLAALGADDPTEAYAGTLKFEQTVLNLDLAGSVDWNRPVNLAFGLEWREDRYQIEAGEPLSWADGGVPNQNGGRAAPGIQVFPGFRPSNEVDEDRNNLGVYAEIDTDLSEKMNVNGALRFEDYSDFGNNVSFKLAGRYEINDQTSVRASASTGFRAPSLQQSFFNNTSTQFVVDEITGDLVPFEVGTFRQGDAVTKALGVPALEEETSQNFSLGFTVKPNDNFQLTVDAFKIDIDDRIVISGSFQASNPVVADLLAPFDVNAAQFFSNAIDTETEGVDIVTAYATELANGSRLRLTVAANWNQTDVVGDVRTPAPLAVLGETLFNRIERERIETAQPRNSANVGLNYTKDAFGASLRLNHFGSVKTVESNSDFSRDQVHGAETLTDLDLYYNINDFRITLGANNLFDVYPDEQIPANSFNGIFPYSRRTAPFGFNGGYYYLRLNYSF